MKRFNLLVRNMHTIRYTLLPGSSYQLPALLVHPHGRRPKVARIRPVEAREVCFGLTPRHLKVCLEHLGARDAWMHVNIQTLF